jgi:hypothetical protein
MQNWRMASKTNKRVSHEWKGPSSELSCPMSSSAHFLSLIIFPLGLDYIVYDISLNRYVPSFLVLFPKKSV